jgi:hypothetical protein
MKLHTIIPTVLVKQAKGELNIDELVNKETKPGFFSKALLLPSYRRESGRVSGLAELMGENPGLSVSHPVSSRIANNLAGTSIGAILLAALTKGKGAGVGATLGWFGGSLNDTMNNTKEKERILEIFDKKNKEGAGIGNSLKPGNTLASLISGVHQSGRADALDFANKNKIPKADDRIQTAAELINLTGLATPISLPVALGNSYVDFSNAKRRIGEINSTK